MKKVLSLVIFMSLISVYLFNSNDSATEDSLSVDTNHSSHAVEKKKSAALPEQKIKDIKKVSKVVKPNMDKPVLPPFSPKNEDQESLGKISSILKDAMDSSKDSDSFKENLKKAGLTPIIAKDKNPYTGNMKVIRTKENLTGTRYIHAQYFENEEGVETLQHLSFEYRPGPGALMLAASAVKAHFEIKEEPDNIKKDFIGWTLDNGYVVWCSKRNYENLQQDPFNAYTKNDDGTIRCATELNIHEGDMNDHPGE